ncbi:hypothetical protein [Streptomyces pratensis]|uniref:hypothetical protein n=1 Tax=Streptomyces pratensis TaxID=1169025 RepID=UPI0019331E58|nr:hypothetical protein [Streptomyces pratensis]
MDVSSEYTHDDGPAQKVSISMPASRVAAVRARVGARGFSAYISAAVERQIQRDLLEELLQASEDEAGPIPQAMTDRAAEAFRAAEALTASENGGEGEQGSQGDSTWHDRTAS